MVMMMSMFVFMFIFMLVFVMLVLIPVMTLFTPWPAVVLFHIDMFDIRATGVQHDRYAVAGALNLELSRQIDTDLPVAAIQPEP
jgi:hypothetical protein